MKPSRKEFWTVWTLLIAGCVVFWIVVARASYTWLKLEHAREIAECRGDAQEANEHRTQLLSGGRFVRKFDPKLGNSVYTFHKHN